MSQIEAVRRVGRADGRRRAPRCSAQLLGADGLVRRRRRRRGRRRAPGTRSTFPLVVRRDRARRAASTASTCSCCAPDQARAWPRRMMGVDAGRRRGRAERDRAVGGRRGDEPDDGNGRRRRWPRRSARRPRSRRRRPSIIAAGETAEALGEARFTARFTLARRRARRRRSCRSCRPSSRRSLGVVVRPAARRRRATLRRRIDAPSAEPRRRPTTPTLAAVERTARHRGRRRRREVLTTLIGERGDGHAAGDRGRSPTTRSARSAYPLVTVEVAYVSGVNGRATCSCSRRSRPRRWPP